MARTIKIDKDICTKVERAHYEYNALMNVEKAYLDDHMLDPDGSAIESPIFKMYHEKAIEALKAYEEAKLEMTREYGIENVGWHLDFATSEVSVSD